MARKIKQILLLVFISNSVFGTVCPRCGNQMSNEPYRGNINQLTNQVHIDTKNKIVAVQFGRKKKCFVYNGEFCFEIFPENSLEFKLIENSNWEEYRDPKLGPCRILNSGSGNVLYALKEQYNDDRYYCLTDKSPRKFSTEEIYSYWTGLSSEERKGATFTQFLSEIGGVIKNVAINVSSDLYNWVKGVSNTLSSSMEEDIPEVPEEYLRVGDGSYNFECDIFIDNQYFAHSFNGRLAFSDLSYKKYSHFVKENKNLLSPFKERISEFIYQNVPGEISFFLEHYWENIMKGIFLCLALKALPDDVIGSFGGRVLDWMQCSINTIKDLYNAGKQFF